jgi:hypothetical protein
MNKIIKYRVTNYVFLLKTLVFLTLLVTSCSVVFIKGYDPIAESTLTKLQRDFNLHFIKLARTIQDDDTKNQSFTNFQDYYDQMNADLFTLKSRVRNFDKKGGLVKKQINNLDSTLHAFEMLHKNPGFKDSNIDDRRDIRDGINSSFEAVIKLQEALKPKK